MYLSSRGWLILLLASLFIVCASTAAMAVQPQIAGGRFHTLVLDVNGTLWASGQNNYGQVGNGTTINALSPVQLPSVWTKITAGGYFSVGIKSDGTLWSWGANTSGYALGRNIGAQYYSNQPGQIGSDNDWVDVFSGAIHTLALKSDGSLWAWGYNSAGQLGRGTMDSSLIPIQVGTDTDWKSISAGEYHSLAIKTNGTLWVWGSNSFGEMGNNSRVNVLSPLQVGTATDWLQAVGGSNFTIALKTDHTRWVWGTENNGASGDGWNSGYRLTPYKIPGENDWSAISAGYLHGMGLKLNGSLWTWGYNYKGEIGNNTTTDKFTPYNVNPGQTYTVIPRAMMEAEASFAGKSDGSVQAWGFNNNGRFGDGTNVDKKVPSPSLFNLGQLTLTTVANPSNQGSISGPGINCGSQGSDCNEAYPLNQQVTLTALEEPGYTLHYWYDGQNYTYYTTQLTVTMNASKTVTAYYAPLPGISVSVSPEFSGTVVENIPQNPRISCPGDCEEALDYNQQITLTAQPQPGYTFVHWMVGGNVVSTSSTDTFTITDPMHLSAVFQPIYSLTVVSSPVEGGSITSDIGGISCNGSPPNTCQQDYPSEQNVQVSAHQNLGFVFDHWELNGYNKPYTQNPLQVTMYAANTLKAVFLPVNTLAVTVDPTDAGSVSNDVNGLICSQSCQTSVSPGTVATLTAAANPGWVFDVWVVENALYAQDTLPLTLLNSRAVKAVFRPQTTGNEPDTEFSLSVPAINQKDSAYRFFDGTGSAGPAGCVPVSFTMMFLYYFNSMNPYGIQLDNSAYSENTEKILESMAMYLDAYIQKGGTWVDDQVTLEKMRDYSVSIQTSASPQNVYVQWDIDYLNPLLLSSHQTLDVLKQKLMNGEPAYVSGWVVVSQIGMPDLSGGHAVLATGYKRINGVEYLLINDTWNNDSHWCTVNFIESDNADGTHTSVLNLCWDTWDTVFLTINSASLLVNTFVAVPKLITFVPF